MLDTFFRRLRLGAVALTLALTGHLALARYNLDITVHDATTGAVVDEQHHHNLVVTSGLNLIRDLLANDGVAGITHFATGTGSTTPALSQTALVAEVTREATTAKTKAAGQLTVSYYMGSTVGNGNTLAEVGLFNASSSGTMYARALVAPTIAKTSAITVTFTWVLTWA